MLYITGITGHSGRWFLDRLVKEQYQGEIKCLVRDDKEISQINYSNLRLELVFGNLEDKELLAKSMVGASTVVHISSILLSENVIEAAILNNVEWAILVHTTGRYSKYKSASEEYIRIEDNILEKRNQIGITVLRPTMIYGSSRDRNMFKLISYLSDHKFFPMFGKGRNLMQPVHAKDLGDAYFDVLMNKEKTFNKEYNLPGKSPIQYIDLVKCVSETLQRKNVVLRFPLWFSILAARIYNSIRKNAIISVEQVLRMQEDKAFSYEEATNDFNYMPVAFKDGIKDEVKEFIQSQKRGKKL